MYECGQQRICNGVWPVDREVWAVVSDDMALPHVPGPMPDGGKPKARRRNETAARAWMTWPVHGSVFSVDC